MELYSSDKPLNDMGESDFHDILDNDVFHPTERTSSGYGMDDDWLDSLFEDPVLNDKMMTEAVQQPKVTSEHSYSISDNPASPLGVLRMEDYGKVTDMELDSPYNNTALDLTQKHNCQQMRRIKPDPDTLPITANHKTVTVRQPTIVLATSTHHSTTTLSESYLVPKINIKLEPSDAYDTCSNSSTGYERLSLPPTPPSSTNSDSEGCVSPQRSPPSSPIRHVAIRHPIRHISQASHPLFTSPIPQSGILILSEEEKRTLISEGYHIPNKLPLTKQEEKNLKKIRRKIKNKISAQESRRKKKEYLENLEKRVEQFTSENTDLRKKVNSLENNNQSLLSQLQKLQAMVGRATSSPTQSTCLMVLVLCFAIFVPWYSPSSLSIGYSQGLMPTAAPSSQVALQPSPNMGPRLSVPSDARAGTYDDYNTPNMRSRVLLSMKDEDAEGFGPQTPLGYFKLFTRFFNGDTCSSHDTNAPLDEPIGPPPPVALDAHHTESVVTETEQEENRTEVAHANMHPDIAAELLPNLPLDTRVNATA